MAEKRIQSFRDLDAWELGMKLAVVIYGVLKHIPQSERFGLSTRLPRAVVSVPSNVAQGQSCGEDGRYIHHLRVATARSGNLVPSSKSPRGWPCCRPRLRQKPRSTSPELAECSTACSDTDFRSGVGKLPVQRFFAAARLGFVRARFLDNACLSLSWPSGSPSRSRPAVLY